MLPEAMRGYLATALFTKICYLENADAFAHDFATMMDCFALPEDIKNEAIQAQLAALLIKVVLQITQQNRFHLESGLVPKLLEFIHMNLQHSELLSQDVLAQRFFISKSQLNKLFQREMGISISKYIRYKRYEYAEIFRSHGIPAVEAAAKAGFQSYSTYYRLRAVTPDDVLPTCYEGQAVDQASPRDCFKQETDSKIAEDEADEGMIKNE